MADLSLTLKFRQCANPFLNRSGRGSLRGVFPGGPVNLVEVNGIDSQSFETGLALTADRVGLQIVRNLAGIVPD